MVEEALGESLAAARAYARALVLDPTACEAANNLGALHAALGGQEAARELFEFALSVRPDYGLARANLVSLNR